MFLFFFSSRRRHTRLVSDWSSDACSSDLLFGVGGIDHRDRVRLIEPGEKEKVGVLPELVEIGRASCRERVEIWVGAVCLKKKNRTDKQCDCSDSKDISVGLHGGE